MALLTSRKFFELRHRQTPILGEEEGPTRQRKVIGYREEYQLAWEVADAHVRWVHARTLDELPHLISVGAWQ